jgi:hypothetical protein
MSKNKKPQQPKKDQIIEASVEQVDWAAIAALEKQAAAVAFNEVKTEEKQEVITFEDWWLMREQQLNKPYHYKEILRVDFKARGLGKKELLEKWDWAAKQFGLKW